ncbi:MAG: sterol desaturase family protein [Proteobacteria bacterium]|nr:MAG: sterol desaturase family protein [Pseudomonadota bacterium]
MYVLDSFLRSEIELLQYLAFFGALLLLAALELRVQRNVDPPDRARRWPVNFALTFLNVLMLGVLPVSGVLVADYARDHGLGLLNLVESPLLFLLVAGLLLRSLVAWITHLAMHKIPLLWRVHRVHHADTFLDVSTTVRFHPLEFLVSTPLLVGSVLVLGISPAVLMLYELLDAVMAVFTHANVRLPGRLERIARCLIVTPEMHRVHHSTRQPETDSNYGATLSIWDHAFGTFRAKPSPELDAMPIGLEEFQDDRTASLGWLLALPFGSARATTGLGSGRSVTDSVDGRGGLS